MRKTFVIDNSVVMAWCFEDQANTYSDHVLDSLEKFEAVVPAIWPLEVGNVLLVAERKKKLTEADSIRFLSLLNKLPIIVDQESPERIWGEIISLARHTQISTYDASYLDLAMRSDFPIATQDKGLIAAAKRVNVALFEGR